MLLLSKSIGHAYSHAEPTHELKQYLQDGTKHTKNWKRNLKITIITFVKKALLT